MALCHTEANVSKDETLKAQCSVCVVVQRLCRSVESLNCRVKLLRLSVSRLPQTHRMFILRLLQMHPTFNLQLLQMHLMFNLPNYRTLVPNVSCDYRTFIFRLFHDYRTLSYIFLSVTLLLF